jgi:ribosomal RNA-processing protein 7
MAKAAAATARGSKRRAASDADATPSSGKKAKKNAKKSKSSAKKRSDGDAHGWRPLPVRLDFGSAFTRHLFVRVPSANAAEGATEGTALFVAAIPLGWTRAHLRELFEENFGAVEETSLVTLDAAPDVAGGLVRFASASGAKKALAASVRGGDALDPPASLAPTSIGLEKWVGHHRHARPGSEVRSIHWSPYDRVRVVNAIP